MPGVFLVNTEPEGDAMSSYFLGQVAGALIGLPFLSGETDFSFVPMVCIFALGVFQLGLSYVLIARGIATTPPMTASLVTAIEPILTPVWVALAYGRTAFRLFACRGGAGALQRGMVQHARQKSVMTRRPTFETPGRTAENPRSRGFSHSERQRQD